MAEKTKKGKGVMGILSNEGRDKSHNVDAYHYAYNSKQRIFYAIPSVGNSRRDDVWLTLVVLAGVGVMVAVIRLIGGKSAKYFMRQQMACWESPRQTPCESTRPSWYLPRW